MCNQLALLAEFDSGGVVRMFPTMCSFVGRSTGMNYEYVFVLMVFFASTEEERQSLFSLNIGPHRTPADALKRYRELESSVPRETFISRFIPGAGNFNQIMTSPRNPLLSNVTVHRFQPFCLKYIYT